MRGTIVASPIGYGWSNHLAKLTDHYTDSQLEGLLADLGSDLVERTESLGGDAPRRVREAVCAFANDLPDHGRAGRGRPRTNPA